MRIAVDVDGVLARRVPAVLELLADRHGVDLDVEEVTGWDVTVPEVGETLPELFARTDEDHEHLLGLSPVEGAVDGTNALAEDHELLVATYRKPSAREATVRWLERTGIAFDTYVRDVGDGKTNVTADVLIDDSASVAEAFAADGGRAVLFRRPWNAGREPDGVAVVDDWTDLLDHVESLSAQP